MMIVADASVSASWFLDDEVSAESDALLKEVIEGKLILVEPFIWYCETLNIIQMAVRRKRISVDRAREGFSLLKYLPVEFHDLLGNSFQIFDSALKYGLSAYDASYLTLAEIRGTELYTADKDLLKLKKEFKYVKDIRTFLK